MATSRGELARSVSFINHHLKGPWRYGFVYHYLSDGKSFENLYDQHQSYGVGFFAKGVIMIALTIAFPLIYGWSILPYPCSPDVMLINGVQTEMLLCGDVHEILRSPLLLLMAPAILLLDRVGEWILMRCRPGTRLLLYMYKLQDFCGPKVAKLKYHKNPMVFNLTCATYFLLVIQMALVTLILKSALAAVIGYAAGELLLFAANVLLAPSPHAIAIMDGQLQTWSKDATVRPLLMRLGSVTADVCAVCDRELGSLEKALMGPLKKMHEDVNSGTYHTPSLFGGFERNDVPWGSLHLQAIFVPEDGSFIPVASNDEQTQPLASELTAP